MYLIKKPFHDITGINVYSPDIIPKSTFHVCCNIISCKGFHLSVLEWIVCTGQPNWFDMLFRIVHQISVCCLWPNISLCVFNLLRQSAWYTVALCLECPVTHCIWNLPITYMTFEMKVKKFMVSISNAFESVPHNLNWHSYELVNVLFDSSLTRTCYWG